MKKKVLLSVALVAVLIISTCMGTLAYYKKEVKSADNPVRSAKFTVNSNGTLKDGVSFNLSDEPLYPGYSNDIFDFEIDKTGTEVPVKYEVDVLEHGKLFEQSKNGKDSPVAVTLLRKSGDKWLTVNSKKIDPNNDVEKFKIKVDWNHSDYDIDFQGLNGYIDINVIAQQIDGEVDPDDPGKPEEDPEVTVYYRKHVVLNNFGYISIETKKLEDAQKFDVIYRLSDGTPQETKIVNIGQESGLIFCNGKYPVDIRVYDDEGNLINTFKNVELNIKN